MNKPAVDMDVTGILDRITDLFICLDSEWNITYLNAPARRAFQLQEAAEPLGNLWDCLPEVGSAFYRKFQQSLSQNAPLAFEGFYPPTEKWFEAHTYPNKVGGLDVFLRDISERKRSDQELKRRETYLSTLLDHMVDAIICIDAAGTIQFVNPAVEAIFGFTAHEIIGKNVSMLMPEEVANEHEDYLKRYLRSLSGPVIGQGREVTGQRKNGNTFPVDLAVNRMLIDDQAYFIGTLRDITERKKNERELIEHKDQLERLVAQRTRDLELARDRAMAASKSKSTFLANMSHELRTPLNAIIGYSEMLAEDLAGGPLDGAQTDVQKIRSAGKHLLNLINDILDLSKIEAGRMENHIEPFALLPVIENVVASIDPLIMRSDNKTILDLSADIGTIESDVTKVRQILFNLISNANKFTHGGSITISCRRQTLADSEFIEFIVADSGIGMSNEQQAKIFQPFVQGDSSTTKKYGGTGLGLAITDRLCSLLGGSISLKSSEGTGTTFTVRLPVVSPRPSEKPQQKWFSVGPKVDPASVRFRAAPAEFADRRTRLSTVLVIDDDANVRDLMERFLTRQGYNAITAANAAEGIELAKENRPDVITLDVMMPEKDGWSVLGDLKNDPELADIPVIMLTMVEDKELGLALGAADYLSKPVDPARLAQSINKHLRRNKKPTALIVEPDETGRSEITQVCKRLGLSSIHVSSAAEAITNIAQNVPDFVITDISHKDSDGLRLLDYLKTTPACLNVQVIALAADDMPSDHKLKLNNQFKELLYASAPNPEQFLDELTRLIASKVRGKK